MIEKNNYINYKARFRENKCYNFLNNKLVVLNGILDPPKNIKCEDNEYFGDIKTDNRVVKVTENLKKWKKIYDTKFKFDIVFTDNSSDIVFAAAYIKISKLLSFTNSFIVHWNKNPLEYMYNNGGEKSGLCHITNLLGSGISFALEYKTIFHCHARYTFDVDYDWNYVFNMFEDKNLDLLIVPSRYGRPGVNSNCTILKPKFWIKWLEMINYTPANLNYEGIDMYKTLRELKFILTENKDINEQPYKLIDKTKMRLWLNPPYKWYRKTKEVEYKETNDGYEIV